LVNFLQLEKPFFSTSSHIGELCLKRLDLLTKIMT